KPFQRWKPFTKEKLGMRLLKLLIDSTGMVAINVSRMNRKSHKSVVASDSTLDWIEKFNGKKELMRPFLMPTVDRPNPYVSPKNNIDYVGKFWIMKARNSECKHALAYGDMTQTYAALNVLQATPWKINNTMRKLVEALFLQDKSIGKLVGREYKIPLPERPSDIDTNDDSRKAWRRKARVVYKDNIGETSKKLLTYKCLSVAELLKDNDFYFPYQIDWRGRTYAVPSFLQPQGTDVAKSLLQFAEGTILDSSGAFWMAVHGANLWGFDKVTFEERKAWVEDNYQQIERCALDPLGTEWWRQADEPLQFVAWCMEWAKYADSPAGYICHTPVAMDGSNNGLQILSLLTRDEDSGKSTNVTPGPLPEDIYADVANTVRKVMQSKLDGDEDVEKCAYWLNFEFDRKVTKRPVMVLPYGGTLHSCVDYVTLWHKEQLVERGLEEPEDYRKLNWFMAKEIWHAISKEIDRPVKLMEWMHKVASMFGKKNLPIKWVTPTGLPVVQIYRDSKLNQITTKLGYALTMWVNVEKDTMSVRRHRNGFSPNFVHSLDGSALHKATLLASKGGVKSFAMIHDSYGVLPSQVDIMAAACRLSFSEIFSEDQIGRLKVNLEQQLGEQLPEVPDFGTLTPQDVRESEFFFS
ncbi:hypothetical protein COB55_04125, partial [Candidatus Wolfebacteria bacterium]